MYIYGWLFITIFVNEIKLLCLMACVINIKDNNNIQVFINFV